MADEYVISKKQDLVAIADAVRGKTGKTGKLSFSQLSVGIEEIPQTEAVNLDEEIAAQDNVISQIQTALEGKAANTGIDTSDATATEEDIASGKTAYVGGVKVTGTHECPSGLDTSDATATAADIASGKTAYIGGVKVTGTHTCSSGGGSGASCDTCTVTFWNDLMGASGGSVYVKFSIYDSLNNRVTTSSDTIDKLTSTTVSNVVCGSLALLIPVDWTMTTQTLYIGDASESLDAATYHSFVIPNESNAEIDISIGI